MTRLCLIALAFLALGACVSTGPIVADKAPCSKMIASGLRKDVEGPPLAQLPPAPDESLRNTEPYTDWLEKAVDTWRNFGVAAIGQLKQANGAKAASIETVEDCEARDAAAIERSRKKVLGVF